MKAKNPWIGTLCSKVAMSLLLAVISASSVSAQNDEKVKVADSTNVTTVVTDTVVVKNNQKAGKNTRRTNDKWILNSGKKGDTTTGTTPPEFQDGDDIWLRFRDGHRFITRPTEKGLYLYKGKKIAIQ
jgi:hypothetical protein